MLTLAASLLLAAFDGYDPVRDPCNLSPVEAFKSDQATLEACVEKQFPVGSPLEPLETLLKEFGYTAERHGDEVRFTADAGLKPDGGLPAGTGHLRIFVAESLPHNSDGV